MYLNYDIQSWILAAGLDPESGAISNTAKCHFLKYMF